MLLYTTSTKLGNIYSIYCICVCVCFCACFCGHCTLIPLTLTTHKPNVVFGAFLPHYFIFIVGCWNLIYWYISGSINVSSTILCACWMMKLVALKKWPTHNIFFYITPICIWLLVSWLYWYKMCKIHVPSINPINSVTSRIIMIHQLHV